ncbi:DUF421 domain-containing protein [Rhodococcus pyridinivorans]|uniref:DUF421 domain-containing protein n=1 Tax=Rhodococcus pyridinivorans TaxID=103816 RepID=UPI0020791924|nr:YetF domain-containing protein [Rhodococcus pyridinivorans]USI90175.1 DUF421 domain-containing protein [Rhodococcus pyridinivorans]
MSGIEQAVLGDWHAAAHAAVKALLLFLTAAAVFRVTVRRTLAECAPFDWVAVGAAGAIVGRTATATDASWLTGTAALVAILAGHAVVARARFIPGIRRWVDPPIQVLIRDGRIDHRTVRRCGLTVDDLEAILRQHGYDDPTCVRLAVVEERGASSVLPSSPLDSPQP